MANTPRSYLVTTPEGNIYLPKEQEIHQQRSSKEEGYLSDDDDTNCGDTSDGSPAEESAQSMHDPSTEFASTPIQRSTRNVKRPARYNDTWSLRS